MNWNTAEDNNLISSDTEEMIQVDKIQQLYKQSLPAAFISLVTASLLARILWLNDQSSAAFNWWIAIIAATAVRILVFFLYNRAQPAGIAVLGWALPYLMTLMISSMIWGFGALIILPKDSLLYHAIIFYFLMGMCAGAMAVYSTNQSYALSTIYLVLGPVTIWSLFQESYVSFFMGIGALIFLVSAAQVTKVIAKSQYDSFLRKYQLTAAEQKVEDMAKMDPLTGILNRRGFESKVSELTSNSRDAIENFSLMALSVDQLQKVNDAHGHETGDEVLKTIGTCIKQTILDGDICARLGGDEFIILLPNAGQDMGILVAEKLNDEIASTVHSAHGEHFSVSVSIGVAENTDSIKTALIEAEKAMFQAKKEGRNQYIVFKQIQP